MNRKGEIFGMWRGMREEDSQRIGATLQYNSARSKDLHDFGYDGFVADDEN